MKRSGGGVGDTGGSSRSEAEWANSWLEECGLVLKSPPEPHELLIEPVTAAANISRTIRRDPDPVRTAARLAAVLRHMCDGDTSFRHLVFPHVLRVERDAQCTTRKHVDPALKLLLNVMELQDELADAVFERTTELAAEEACSSWIKNILRCFSTLDRVVTPDAMARRLMDLLDVTVERAVRLEVILAIPDILGDSEHDSVATELSRFMNDDPELIPAILDCLSYLCLSDGRYDELRRKTIGILRTTTQFNFFPNFVKFLLAPGRTDEVSLADIVRDLRGALSWTNEVNEEIATSQVLTASAIRNSITGSKITAGAWLKMVSTCKISSDQKPIDMIILLILYTTSDDRQKIVQNLIRKQINLNILKEELIDEAFKMYKPIFKHFLTSMIELVIGLLKLKSDNLVVSVASHWYINMFTELENSRQTIIAELLYQGLSSKQSMVGMLCILKDIATNDIALLKSQSLQMLPLLDKTDDLNLHEIREIMSLLSGLAYSFENSVLRDDMHMIIRKQLGSSDPTVKIKGILAAVQAIKYLTNDRDNNVDISENINLDTYEHLSDGPTKEAAQMIELISKSTKMLPDIIGFFYDELSEVLGSASHINKHFLFYLADAVTNDLEQNFIVNELPQGKINNIDVSLQYCLNAEEELTDFIAINIAGMALKKSTDDIADITILPSLFQLVQIVHSKKDNGDLSNIDALLGSPVILPNIDPENCAEDYEEDQIFAILDCLIHCSNWFRELVNAFSTQPDNQLKQKIIKRIEHIEDIERTINEILISYKKPYKPPMCVFDMAKYTERQTEKKVVLKRVSSKTKAAKKPKLDDTVIPATTKSQMTQVDISNVNLESKGKFGVLENIPSRNLNLNILNLLNEDIRMDVNSSGLSMNTFVLLLKYINKNLSSIMISRIKKNTFLAKQENTIYDHKKAESTAKRVLAILPKLNEHLEDLTKHLKDDNNYDSIEFNPKLIDIQLCLEQIFISISIYLKWMGFRKNNQALLKSSLRAIICANEHKSSKLTQLKELLLIAAKTFQKFQNYCYLASTSVQLIEVIKVIAELSENDTVFKIMKEVAYNFLSRQWKSAEGLPEKGLIFNQYVDKVVVTYFIRPDMRSLKSLVFQIKDEITKLTGKNDNLSSLKCISKTMFPILYRNLVGAVNEASKHELNKGLTDSQHLELWKDMAMVLKTLSEIAKILETRNNLSAFLKKSQPVIKLFLSQGMPMMEIKLKTEPDAVIEVLRLIQQSTRFLQTLCCHSRLKKDSALMAKVPQIRLLLETLIYKVKAALAANKCSEAFWMGHLKNKNIQGEVIQSQASVNSDNDAEDSDDQLPEDDEEVSDDDNLLNPASKSVSDII